MTLINYKEKIINKLNSEICEYINEYQSLI